MSGTAVAAGNQAPQESSRTQLSRLRVLADCARRSAARAWPALIVYLAIRIVSTLVFAALSAGHGYAQRGLFVFVDSGWYRLIAEYGYNTHLASFGSPFPFFPLFPGLMAAGHLLTGLSVDTVGVAISWTASAACAWALFEIGRLVRDSRTGVLFAALWALLPSAVIEGASYADPLAICLSAWALYAVLRRWWLAAAPLALFAGLTRPTANALVATVCLSALLAIVKQRDGWRPWAALVVPPLGVIAYLSYVAYRMGSVTGYLKAQKKWGTGFSNVQNVAHRIHEGMLGTAPAYQNYPTLITTAVVITVPVLIVLMILQRLPWQLICYTVILAGLVYASIHVYTVVPREFLAVFPVLLPVASLLARIERRASVAVLLTALAVGAGWYACYIPVNGGGSIP